MRTFWTIDVIVPCQLGYRGGQRPANASIRQAALGDSTLICGAEPSDKLIGIQMPLDREGKLAQFRPAVAMHHLKPQIPRPQFLAPGDDNVIRPGSAGALAPRRSRGHGGFQGIDTGL